MTLQKIKFKVLETIVGLLVEKLLNPIGAEADGYLITESHENPFMLGGLNLRSRDYARFGLLYVQNGFMNGR